MVSSSSFSTMPATRYGRWRLDPVAPTIDAIAATPFIIDHNATTQLTATTSDVNPGDTLSHQWVSDSGGTFGNAMARNTSWTPSSGTTDAHAAELTLTVTDLGGLSAMASVTVTVREMGAPPLALPAIADKAGVTGAVVDVVIAAATNGRAPYSYTFDDLPPELGGIGRRIRGQLITPGTYTVTATVTDANGDTASRMFDWVVTGTAIVPPCGHQRPHRLGAGVMEQPERQRDGAHPLRHPMQARQGHSYRGAWQDAGGRPWSSSSITTMACTTRRTRAPH